MNVFMTRSGQHDMATQSQIETKRHSHCMAIVRFRSKLVTLDLPFSSFQSALRPRRRPWWRTRSPSSALCFRCPPSRPEVYVGTVVCRGLTLIPVGSAVGSASKLPIPNKCYGRRCHSAEPATSMQLPMQAKLCTLADHRQSAFQPTRSCLCARAK